ncbi:MAG: efflux RND transporter permease subunit, partial [Actinomycetota bacterium]
MTDLLERPGDAAPPEPVRAPGGGRGSFITGIAAAAARRWQRTLALLIVVVALGAYAFGPGLAREGFPPINTPIAVVSGQFFVDDAERLDEELARPLEAAFAEVEGVVETTTESRPNEMVVVVEFESDISSEDGTARIEALNVPVPDESIVVYRSVNAAQFVGEYDLLVSIVGPDGTSPADLEAQAEALSAYLAADGEIESAVVRELLTELADPETGESEVRLTRFTRVALSSAGYQDAVAIGIVRAEGSDLDVLEFTDRVERLIDAPDAPLGDEFDAEVTADFATGIRQQLSSLTSNLLTGLIAVAIVSLLLIGWRVALVTAGFMGLVIMGALAGLWTVGYTLNTITLFGLILTLGLLVDDAIVISESIDASRDEPDESEPERPVGVVRTAIDRVGSASFAGTLTTVVVFSPIIFVGGILGEFIRPIPITVIITLLMSFLFSIVFIPLFARVFLLRGNAPKNPIITAEKKAARALGRLAGYPAGRGARGFFAGLGLALVAVVAIMTGGSLAGNLGFSVFPSGKDATGMFVGADFAPGTSIEEAQGIADEIDAIVLEELGDELVRSQYVRGNERVTETFIDLTPIDSRSTTAPQFVERIEERVAELEGVRVSVSQTENGPPVADFPFAAQIEIGADPSTDVLAAAEGLASDISVDLLGQSFDVGGETVTIVDTQVSTEGVVARIDGGRYVEVRAKYDSDDAVSSNLDETQTFVEDRYGSDEVEARGLAGDALGFDFGDESDNQDDFAALGVAGLVALALMLVLITIQFRSLAQSLLIFLAIPFSFLGVFTILTVTDNPLSFLVSVGFIALIGVAVNNTILLVDAANQARGGGPAAREAMSEAGERRLRPRGGPPNHTVGGRGARGR